jgi:hypothetical protein
MKERKKKMWGNYKTLHMKENFKGVEYKTMELSWNVDQSESSVKT